MNGPPLLSAFFPYGPEALAAAVATPLVASLVYLLPRLRRVAPILLTLAPLPALAAAILAVDSAPLVLDQMLVPIVLALDRTSALLLGVSAFLWIAAGAYAAAYLRERMESGWLGCCWLLTLAGNIAVFMAADLVSFYLAFTLVSLPAYGLIVRKAAPDEKVGLLYVAIAVLGETFLVMAFVLLALGSKDRSLLIFDAVEALSHSPWRDSAIALLIAGFGAKIGLAPFHIWMPSAYRTAPIPAAAALSGAAVKAGVIGLIRFLPSDAAFPDWGEALAAVGMFTAFYGVVIGLAQTNPKTILAYSSVSQMGLIAAMLGMGMAMGNPGLTSSAAFYAAHHVLAKGGLFLSVGVVRTTSSRQFWLTIPPTALLALGLAGLPLTGGALAKIMAKDVFGGGFVGALSDLSAIATTLLMLRFLQRLAPVASSKTNGAGPGLIAPWLATIVVSLALPWAYSYYSANGVEAEWTTLASLWKTAWPVLVGVIAASVARRWSDRMPTVPEGDILVFGSGAIDVLARWGAYVERAEIALRKWPVGAAALLTVVLILTAAGAVGR